MDHEVVPRHYKICERLLNLSQDHISLHQAKYSRVTMAFEIPKRHDQGLHYPLTWFNGFCGGRGKNGTLVENGKGPMAEKCCYSTILMKLFLEKRRWSNKRMVKLFQNCPFLTYFIKNQHFLFLSAWSFLLIHIRLTPSKGPRRLCKQIHFNSFLWTIQSDHGVNRPQVNMLVIVFFNSCKTKTDINPWCQVCRNWLFLAIYTTKNVLCPTLTQ